MILIFVRKFDADKLFTVMYRNFKFSDSDWNVFLNPSKFLRKKLPLTSLEIWNSYIPVWNPKSVSKLLFLASFPQGRLIKLSSCRRKQGRERRKKSTQGIYYSQLCKLAP